MLARIANREDLDQTASSDLGLALFAYAFLTGNKCSGLILGRGIGGFLRIFQKSPLILSRGDIFI